MDRRSFLMAPTILIAPAGAATRVAADPSTQTYGFRQLNLVCSSSPGGGYDLSARILAQHIQRHLAGSPSVVVQNMPGAGGISAANYLYSLAAKDGSIIGGIQNTVPFEPLLGTTQAKFDPRRFGWIGSPSSETGVLFVWHDAPVNSFQDLLSKEITIATSGADSEPSFYGRLFNAVLGTKMRLVSGYPGQSEAYMAMENREVDGYPVGYWSSLNASKPEWLRDKKIKILLQFGERPNKELPNVPFALDFAKSDADRALLKAAFAPLAIGRPYLTPPGVPKRLLSALREAFVETMADPQYVIDAKRAHLASANPHTGSEVQDLIDQAYATPSDVLSRLRKLTRE